MEPQEPNLAVPNIVVATNCFLIRPSSLSSYSISNSVSVACQQSLRMYLRSIRLKYLLVSWKGLFSIRFSNMTDAFLVLLAAPFLLHCELVIWESVHPMKQAWIYLTKGRIYYQQWVWFPFLIFTSVLVCHRYSTMLADTPQISTISLRSGHFQWEVLLIWWFSFHMQKMVAPSNGTID